MPDTAARSPSMPAPHGDVASLHAPNWRDWMTGVNLLGMALGAIIVDLTGAPSGLFLAGAGLLTFAICAWPRLPMTGRAFLIAAVVAGGSAGIWSAAPADLILNAVAQAASLGGLYVALAFLREAGLGSPLAHRAGQDLLRLSPRLRYALLSGGAHVFGLVLNFGVLSLLGAAVRRAAPDGNGSGTQRRLLLSMLRGFSATTMWSPLSVGPIVALAHMPSLSWSQFAPVGAAGAGAMLVLSWIMDRLHDDCPASLPPDGARSRWNAQLKLMLLIIVVIVSILAIGEAAEMGQVTAITLTVPVIASLWIAFQGRSEASAAAAFAQRFGHLTASTLGRSSMEPLILATAAFTGAVIAGAVDPRSLMGMAEHLGLPMVALPPLAFCCIVLGSVVGLNPIISVTVIGVVIGDPTTIGLSPLVMALAYVAAWGIAIGMSPFTASTMIIGSFAGVPSHRVGLDFNGRYSLIAVVGWVVVLTFLAAAF